MSRRRAARKIDSPSRMSTSRSSMKKVLGLVSLVLMSSAPVLRPSSPRKRGSITTDHCYCDAGSPPSRGRQRNSWQSPASSPTPQRLLQFFREELQNAQQRVRRRLAQAADRRVLHQLGQLSEQTDVPRPLLHQLRGLLAADAARCALAAAFVLEEAHQV